MIIKLDALRFDRGLLREMLPDVETALFFAKTYKLGAAALSELLRELFNTPLVDALTRGDHSTELQVYLGDVIADMPAGSTLMPSDLTYKTAPPEGELLAKLWEQAEVGVAESIQQVSEKLTEVLVRMPGKQASMTMSTLAKLNRQRQSIGIHEAGFTRPYQAPNLVILDVSGSMTSRTIEAIVEDVVALSYKADAHLAIVSNDTFLWEPGGYSVEQVLAHAQYGGTYYHSLLPLFDGREWGTVVTIADYDSFGSTLDDFRTASSKVHEVLDISLVNRQTFLSECVGVLAEKVRPLMIAATYRPLQA